jgi:MFS superfamily sulfate permease-like transporter
MLAAALAAMPVDPALRGTLAIVVVGAAGILFLLAATLRLGGLTGFIARPVLRGFAFGLAITIILRQLPAITGISSGHSGLVGLVATILAGIGQWNWWSIGSAALALAMILLLRRRRGVPAAFLILAVGVFASIALDLPARGVKVVGLIAIELHWPAVSGLTWGEASQLAQVVPPLVLILFAESWGTMRSLALRHGDTIAPDRELAAIGVANLAASAVQGMPVGAGFSAGAASEAAGAASRWTGVIAALSLAVLAWIGRPAIAQLPEAVLAAVVIAALTHALDPKPILRLWRIDRDLVIAITAMAGVLLLGVLNGMLVAMALSIIALIRRLAAPTLVELGRLDGGHDYVDLARHPDAAVPPRMIVVRPSEPLFFANAERILADVEARAAAAAVAAVVFSLEESADLDSTALDCLDEFDQRLGKEGRRLQLARVRDGVRDLFAEAGMDSLAARCSYSVDDAVVAIGEKP